jgi:hypothetical protein
MEIVGQGVAVARIGDLVRVGGFEGTVVHEGLDDGRLLIETSGGLQIKANLEELRQPRAIEEYDHEQGLGAPRPAVVGNRHR